MAIANTPARVHARFIARALNAFLEKNDSSVHWVRVIGESGVDSRPRILWPDENHMINILLQPERPCEGIIVLITGQIDRYEPQTQVPVLSIKLLCGPKRWGQELGLIHDFLQELNLADFEPADLEDLAPA